MEPRQKFIVDGHAVQLIAGMNDAGPAVACVVELVELQELHSLTVYFPMGSLAAARHFVTTATSETAERGYRKVMDEHSDVLQLVNQCFGAYLPAWKRITKS